MIVSLICPKHGYQQGDKCSKCEAGGSEETVRINTGEWVKGWYQHIGPTPIYIESKKQLYDECIKHGNMARSLLKPKSREPGYEMKI